MQTYFAEISGEKGSKLAGGEDNTIYRKKKEKVFKIDAKRPGGGKEGKGESKNTVYF